MIARRAIVKWNYMYISKWHIHVHHGHWRSPIWLYFLIQWKQGNMKKLCFQNFTHSQIRTFYCCPPFFFILQFKGAFSGRRHPLLFTTRVHKNCQTPPMDEKKKNTFSNFFFFFLIFETYHTKKFVPRNFLTTLLLGLNLIKNSGAYLGA